MTSLGEQGEGEVWAGCGSSPTLGSRLRPEHGLVTRVLNPAGSQAVAGVL